MVTWLALMAFLLQGLVVQTHVHLASLEAFVPAHHGNQPAPKAPDDCPACQLYAAAAAVLLPEAITTFLPLGWVKSITSTLATLATIGRVHRGWQSRAPPAR
jgi:hypothetical protein